MYIRFACTDCHGTFPARNVCIGKDGAQVCRKCAGEGDNDLDVKLACGGCGQTGRVGSIWWTANRVRATCDCGARPAEVRS